MVVPSTAAARCGPSASAASSGRSRRCTGPRPPAAARTTAATPSGWHACWRAATSSRCGSPTSALEDARDDLQHAKQRMSKFLLRHGLVFDETTPAGRRRGAWTGAYWDWTESLVSVNLFFTSFAKQARRSRKGGFTGCANVFSPIPVTA